MANTQNTIDPFDVPTPGASLTQSPESKQLWETPPKFTDPQAAIEEIFFRMTEDEENLDNILDLMRNETPVEDIAQVLLYRGFTQGLWNPDMIVMLIEPTIYILLNLAEYAKIEAVIYPEDDTMFDDEFQTDDERSTSLMKIVKGKNEETDSGAEIGSGDISEPNVVPKSLMDRITSAVDAKETNDG